ncbi:two-component system chemotaxis sensor kinase CheA [Actinoplanes campanulatus]|uniref:histidine kinase n=1 Tax=Actinoplanes campanulatus TaxID=113559 RepID=A0A7W5AEZ3_9ACTN|nr:response regulator [Actinoplanes campanulatus]MBB3094821.1 two-component system chemotaxis sensor kinase CheA [Actinoplanes campanulatus]GGN07641.1 hybrid sensor histidine kinase/response regulator [Actinoplanes campanulatus]GID36116.1 hybrid sensor histidine kinase/response regulator [Actinoplanes campanulatus]
MAEGRDPLRFFRIEARELVDQISAGVLDLDQGGGPEPVARLLRVAHTLKGAARVVKQKEIADHAHAFEEVLIPYRGGDVPPSADAMRELLRLNDEITARVVELEDPPKPPVGTGPDEPAPAPAPAEVVVNPRAATADLDELLDAIGETTARMAPLRTGCATVERLHRSAEVLADQLRVGRSTTPATARAAAGRLAGELGSAGRRFTDAVDQIQRELDEVRARAEGLRLVPAGSMFTAMRRAVRDAADAEGKRVRFEARGAGVRMGAHLLGPVSGAFLHLVRNAVVHGIEPEPLRLAAGKPAEGTVTVEVERRGRHAVFRCLDDGRGFDMGALRDTARDRGLLPSGAGPPDDAGLLDLVLRGGISTSPSVTEVAGRAIGMDAVREVATRLRGEVKVRSTPGAGASVELAIPLVLLSMTGLNVAAGGMMVTLPLDVVCGCVRLSAEDAATAAVTGRIVYDGSAAPFLPLAEALYAGTAAPESVGIGAAVVVKGESGLFALGVDRLAGTSALVARPLPELARASPAVGSVTVDADGNPRLVLDPDGLAAEVAGGRLSEARPQATAVLTPLPILVVDDSLTTRMLERSILESAGYEVDLAASAEDALEMARTRRYGLFLTDIDMPGIDGFTFVERTRADPRLAGIPAILVSSRASAADRDRGRDAGAGAYVEKGEFDQERLLGHIERLVVRS